MPATVILYVIPGRPFALAVRPNLSKLIKNNEIPMTCAFFQESGEPHGPLSVKNDQGYGPMTEFQADSIFRSPVQGGFPPVVEYHFVRRPFKSF